MESCEIYLVRHGETEWSRSGQHTGRTDLPLTQAGIEEARRIGKVLAHLEFERVLSSPLARARSTCELAGFAGALQLEPDLVEWDYGAYEGLTSAQIHASNPGWMIFSHGAPDGESPDEIAARVDRVIAKLRACEGRIALFAHGHVLRVLTARWIGLSASHGRHFLLDTATLSILGYYRDTPAIQCWNASTTQETIQEGTQ